MSSLGYGAAGTVRGKKGDGASLWGRRGRSRAQSVPASPHSGANGTDGTWAKLSHTCSVPEEKIHRNKNVQSLKCYKQNLFFFLSFLLWVYEESSKVIGPIWWTVAALKNAIKTCSRVTKFQEKLSCFCMKMIKKILCLITITIFPIIVN